MAYDFTIETREEFAALQWIAARYTYAEEILKVCLKASDEKHEDANGDPIWPQTYDLPEYAAWNIQQAVEDEDGFLTCMGGRLKDEVVKLLGAIV